MSENLHLPTEGPSKIKRFNKWIVFWIGIGILGLFLLGAIHWFVIQPGQSQVLVNGQQGWTSITDISFSDITADSQGKVWGLRDHEIVSLDTAEQVERIALPVNFIASTGGFGYDALTFDRKGRIWVGTGNHLGVRELNGEWKIFAPENNMDDPRTTK